MKSFFTSLMFFLLIGVISGQNRSPYLVKDILTNPSMNNTQISGKPVLKLKLNNMILFVMNEGSYGTELWRTDGTPGGTQIVKDINPGISSSNPGNFKKIGNTVFLTANYNTTVMELWKTDGTLEGTVKVKDFSSVHQLMSMGPDLYFFASSPQGTGLWKSDGTTSGTVFLSAAVNVTSNLISGYSAELNSKLYFTGEDPVHGRELWVTDGTTAGTVLLSDLKPGIENSNITEMVVMGPWVYFNGWDGTINRDKLWRTDGTTVGSVVTMGAGSYYRGLTQLTVMNGELYFVGMNAFWNYELWKTNGTAQGTVQVSDINMQNVSPSWGDAYINFLTVVGSELYFFADDGLGGPELWKSDGVTSTMVKDIRPGPSTFPGSSSYGFVGTQIGHIGSRVFFADFDSSHGYELWTSDGTEAGTHVVKDINPSGNSMAQNQVEYTYNPAYLELNGMLYFPAADQQYFYPNPTTSTFGLWKTDGTEAGTTLVKPQQIVNNSSSPSKIVALGSQAYFSINSSVTNAINDNQLWKSDGTASGTGLLSAAVRYIGAIKAVGSTLYVQGHQISDNSYSDNLYKSNGFQCTSFPNYTRMNQFNEMKSIGNTLFFRTTLGNQNSLYSYDGTSALLLKSFWLDANDYYAELGPFGNTLFFSAPRATNDAELWKTDGTVAGTVVVKDINSTGASYPHAFTQMGSALYFAAKADSESGEQLWRTDGTDEGTVMIKNITANQGAQINSMVAMGNNLYFCIDDGLHGKELWKSDGTEAGTVLLKDIDPGATGSGPAHMTVYNSNLYFSADDGIHGTELWKTDGTTNGTVLLDLNPGAISSYPEQFTVSDSLLYFTAFDAQIGKELWSTDGTESGTGVLGDIRYFGDAYPENLTDVNGQLFFSATDDDHGVELWALGHCSVASPIVTRVGDSKRVGDQRQIPATKTCFCDLNNSLMATVDAIGSNPVQGQVQVITTIQDFQPSDHVKRITSIIPYQNFNITNTTGRITLYFTQQEFNDFNAVNPSAPLPVGTNDNQGKSNVRIYRASLGTWEIIDPQDSDIIWNQSMNRWEIAFDTTGFGYFLLVTNGQPLSQESFASSDLSYYPNPTDGVCYLEASQPIDSVAVYDLLGNKIYDETLHLKQASIQLQNYPPGIYLLKVSSQNQSQTIKIIKK